MIQTLFGSLDEQQKPSFLERMKEAVTRTRESLSERIEEAVSFSKEIDRNTLDELEATLIGADLGSTTTREVLGKLREKADRKQIRDVGELKRLLKEELLAILNAANTRPVEKVDGTPGGDPGGRRERHRQDHDHRQAGAGFSLARQDGADVRSRYFSRGRHRAIGSLGAAYGDGSDPDQSRAAIPRRCSMTRCRRRRRGTRIS